MLNNVDSAGFRPLHFRLLLSVIVLLAIIVRLLPFGHVFSEGSVFLYDGDCYLHIRNILLHISQFPHFVTFDYYGGYPVGTPAISPPLIDYVLSFISIIVGLGSPGIKQVEVVAALTPPIIGGFTIVAVYCFAKEIFNRNIAIISSLLIALMPAHIDFTVLGRPDNEMMEPLLATLLFLSYRRIQIDHALRKNTFSLVIYSASLAFLSLLLWRGAILWILLLSLCLLLDMTTDFLKGKVIAKRHINGGSIFLILSAYLLVFCAFNVWGTQNRFSFNIISWFHVAAFSAVAVSILSLGAIFSFWDKRKMNRPALLLLIVLAGCCILGVLFLLSPSSKDNVVAGMGIIGFGKLDPWIQSIQEYQPLLSRENFNISLPATLFGWVFWFLPFIFGYMVFKMHKEGYDRGRVFFIFITLFIFILTISRQRFQHILAINMSIVGGWALYYVYKNIAKKVIHNGRKLALAITCLLSIATFYPFGNYIHASIYKPPGFSIKGYIHDAVLWLKKNTPSPENPYAPSVKPPYSVMARWDFAGWIEALAERPVVATLYGSETYGLKESAAFHLAENEDEANKIMDVTGAKYFVAVKTIGALNTYADILGISGGDYAKLIDDPNTGGKIYQPGRKYWNLVSTRLLFSDGADMHLGKLHLKGLDHYRLIYESRERLNLSGFPIEVKKLKIFEYLQGASLEVITEPGKKVSIVSTVITNRGRLFKFKKEGRADSKGSVRFILPYSRQSRTGMTGLIKPYTILSGENSLSIELSEEDVIEGRQLEISM